MSYQTAITAKEETAACLAVHDVCIGTCTTEFRCFGVIADRCRAVHVHCAFVGGRGAEGIQGTVTPLEL